MRWSTIAGVSGVISRVNAREMAAFFPGRTRESSDKRARVLLPLLPPPLGARPFSFHFYRDIPDEGGSLRAVSMCSMGGREGREGRRKKGSRKPRVNCLRRRALFLIPPRSGYKAAPGVYTYELPCRGLTLRRRHPMMHGARMRYARAAIRSILSPLYLDETPSFSLSWVRVYVEEQSRRKERKKFGFIYYGGKFTISFFCVFNFLRRWGN